MKYTADTFTALRNSLGWTQAQMGEALGLSQAQVSRIEQGKRGITPMLQKILDTLGDGNASAGIRVALDRVEDT